MYTLITGSTGFIGKRLIDKLDKQGTKMKCLVRKSSDLSHLENRNIKLVFGDVEKPDIIKNAMQDVEYVIHLAANATPSNYKPLADYQVNINGTRNILDQCVGRKELKKVLVMSSIAATGPSLDGLPLTEKSECKPITNYGISKLNVERLARQYYEGFGVPIVTVRPPMVYGIGDKDWIDFFKMIKQGSLKNKKLFIPGSHKNLFDFCYVDNLVGGLIQALYSTNTVGQTYFLSDARSYRIEEIIEAVAQAFEIDIPSRYYSTSFVTFVAIILDSLGRLAHFDGPISERDVNWMTTNYWICDCEKAKRDFGYNPTITLEQGIKNTIEWREEIERLNQNV